MDTYIAEGEIKGHGGFVFREIRENHIVTVYCLHRQQTIYYGGKTCVLL